MGISKRFGVSVLLTLVLFIQGYGNNLLRKVNRSMIVFDNFEGPGADAKFGENSDWEVKVDEALVEENSLIFGYYDRRPQIFNTVGIHVESEKSFGVTLKYKLKNFNWFDVVPKEVKRPLKGMIRRISIWVWGGFYNYEMETHFRNQKNEYYRIRMGEIYHQGWLQMLANIPNSISYSTSAGLYYDDVGLRFVKFRFYSTPNARKDRFYTFLDYFTVYKENYRPYYDGQDIEKDVEAIFGQEQAEPNPPVAQ